jgi:hypothetical protein
LSIFWLENFSCVVSGQSSPELQVLCPNGSTNITTWVSRLYRAKNFKLVNFLTWKIFFASRWGRVHPNFKSFVPTIQ